MNKKMVMAVGGLAAGGVAAVVADGAIQNTDYAKSDPEKTFYAKAGGGAAALVAGALLWKKYPLVGAALAMGGGVIAGKGYMDYSSYKSATAPPSVTVTPGAGGAPVTLTGPVVSGAPVQITAPSGGLPDAAGGSPVLIAGPQGVSSGLALGVSPSPLQLPQMAGQSGAAVRLGMSRQSGAAVRLGMNQSGAAVRLGLARR